ncbi:nicotinamide N-methyltransferase-like [Haliotis rufescens]|uniref:nicotinamide N-methyltransferase-like n=1 Tax=Haliotis rufescens TaxID=6454 RepID=UPI00201ED4B5|nr:nicotinamide N-methyltransferase-like [Haliotis rufescens]
MSREVVFGPTLECVGDLMLSTKHTSDVESQTYTAMNRGKFEREDYLKYFDSAAYLKTFHSDIKGSEKEGDLMPWKMKNFHDVFAEGKVNGRRLLDIGTGPTIHSVISASNCCDTIYLSDLAPQNRETLRKWLEGTLQHSFRSFFQYVVDREGKGTSWTHREDELRTKIGGILPIDLLEEDPMAPCSFPRFDIVTTSLCLDSVALDHVGYGYASRKITNLLKIGGFLIVFGLYGASTYTVGEHVFRSCLVTTGEVKDVWTHCGFEIVDWREEKNMENTEKTGSGIEGFFLMTAKRVR